MMYLYSGTPGSGKSLKASQDIYRKLRRGGNVIANFNINLDICKGKHSKKVLGDFTFIDNSDLNVNFLLDYAKEHHKENKENQTLIVIDEAQILFNSRSFNAKDRMEWITFFSQHRHLGYNIILITQMDRMLDRQIRGLIETEYKHRKVNNFKMAFLIPFPIFCQVEYWYPVKEKANVAFFFYSKKFGNLYDTYSMFNQK